MPIQAPAGHYQERFEQHPGSLAWRGRCTHPPAGRVFVTCWRASPDRAIDDLLAHWAGDHAGGHYLGHFEDGT